MTSKLNEELVQFQRSRIHCCHRFIIDKNVKWKQWVHPRENGTAADICDHILYAHLQAEFSLPRYIRAAKFVPPTWLHSTTDTSVGVAPTKICPRLPMIDLNKDKDAKFRLPHHIMPAPSSCVLKPSLDPLINHEFMEMLLKEDEEKMTNNDAKGFWASHMKICNREAFSFGFTATDKEITPTVRGRYGFFLY